MSYSYKVGCILNEYFYDDVVNTILDYAVDSEDLIKTYDDYIFKFNYVFYFNDEKKKAFYCLHCNKILMCDPIKNGRYIYPHVDSKAHLRNKYRNYTNNYFDWKSTYIDKIKYYLDYKKIKRKKIYSTYNVEKIS